MRRLGRINNCSIYVALGTVIAYQDIIPTGTGNSASHLAGVLPYNLRVVTDFTRGTSCANGWILTIQKIALFIAPCINHLSQGQMQVGICHGDVLPEPRCTTVFLLSQRKKVSCIVVSAFLSLGG